MLPKNPVKLYRTGYGDKAIHGQDLEPRPWDLTQVITNLAENFHDPILLDIGCGTSEKLLPLSQYFHVIYGLDPSPDMLELSQKNISKTNTTNIKILQGAGEQLPFPDSSIDIATCMMAKCSGKEIYRVLREGGYAVIELIGTRDKADIKWPFGKDDLGWRGQNLNFTDEDFFETCRQEFSLFKSIEIKNGFWKTLYSEEGLLCVLEETAAVRNFNKNKDADVFQMIIENFKRSKEIEVTQNRILIVAHK